MIRLILTKHRETLGQSWWKSRSRSTSRSWPRFGLPEFICRLSTISSSTFDSIFGSP